MFRLIELSYLSRRRHIRQFSIHRFPIVQMERLQWSCRQFRKCGYDRTRIQTAGEERSELGAVTHPLSDRFREQLGDFPDGATVGNGRALTEQAIPIGFLVNRSLLEYQQFTRQHVSYAFENRTWLRNAPEREVMVEGLKIDFLLIHRTSQKHLHIGRKEYLIVFQEIINGPLTDSVADQQQLFPGPVPQSNRKRSIHMRREIRSVFLIQMNDYLSVIPCDQETSFLLQIGSDFSGIVQLAAEDSEYFFVRSSVMDTI